MRQAARIERIKIVSTQWLLDSISQWQRLAEDAYLVPVHPEDRDGDRDRDGMDVEETMVDELVLSSDEDGQPAGDEKDVDDPDGVMPDDLDENHSPVDGFEGYDWKEVEDDLADFLGSDDDDSETDSGASGSSQNSGGPRKRKRSETSSPADDSRQNGDVSATEDVNGSRLAKRQQLARSRSSVLKAVQTPADSGAGLPSPDTTGEEQVEAAEDDTAEEEPFDEEHDAVPEAQAEGDDRLDGDGDGDGDSDGGDDGELEFDLEQEITAELEKDLTDDLETG